MLGDSADLRGTPLRTHGCIVPHRNIMLHNSLVMFERGQNIVENRRGGRPAPTTVNSSVRTREYLTRAEIERLMAARKSSRYGHRDPTMILIGYRHGLRASDRRAKNGSPSVHPMQGDQRRRIER